MINRRIDLNIEEYTKKFENMEVDNDLFKLKTKDGILFWDIARYIIFNYVYRELINVEVSYNTKAKKSLKKYLRKTKMLKNLINDINYFSKNRGKKYLFYINSRTVSDGKCIDLVSNDLLSRLEEDSFIIESFPRNLGAGFYSNSVLRLIKRFNSLIHLHQMDPAVQKVDRIVESTFPINVSLNNMIIQVINDFRIEKRYYRQLLSRLGITKVFFIRNGVQKALIAAATELKIKTIELQHGAINEFHTLYHYPPPIVEEITSHIIIPDIFLTFSDYWNKATNYPVKTKISIGNSFYYEKSTVNLKEKSDITLISADLYQSKIEEYIDFILKHCPTVHLNLKLHPNQLNEKDKIIRKYSNVNNLNVYYNEIAVSELLKKTQIVVLIGSTVAYEAIQAGCRVVIIKDASSYFLKDLFTHPSVYVIEKPNGLLKLELNEPVNTTYFDDFNEHLFQYLKTQDD